MAEQKDKRGALWACQAGKVFDGENVLTDHAVIIQNDIIHAVVPVHQIPPGTAVLSKPDCTLIPGLIDAHVHFMRWEGPFFCAFGITTIRDIGNRLDWILAQRAESKRDDWPRILCVGPPIDGPAPFWSICRASKNKDEAVHHVKETVAAGVDGLKFYAGLPADWVEPMARAGHDAGSYVAMHCQSVPVLQAGAAGIDEFQHLDALLGDIWPNHPAGWLEIFGHPDFSATLARQEQIADRIRDLGLSNTPTLMIHETFANMNSPDFRLAAADRACLPRELIDYFIAPRPNAALATLWRDSVANAQRFVALMFERGVPILAGTDLPFNCMVPGKSLWGELGLLAGAGMSPRQCLRAATFEAARQLRAPQIGRLQSGCMADMVFVKGDLLMRIPANPDIAVVIRNGHVWDPEDLLTAGKTGMPHAPVAADPWGKEFLARMSAR